MSRIRAGSLVLLFATFATLFSCRAPEGETSRTQGREVSDSAARLDALFGEYLDLWFRFSPTDGTTLGSHTRDAELDDLSAEAIAARLSAFEAYRGRLSTSFDPARLTPALRADLEILENAVDGELLGLRELKPFERNPLVYSSLISDSVYDLLKRDFAPLDTRVKSAIARMRAIPRLLDQARANLRSPPLPQAEVAIRRNKGASSFYESEILEFLRGSSLAEEAAAEGKKTAMALRGYQKWLEEDLLPRATGDWRLGMDLWARKLRHSLNSSLTADEIGARARTEFDRVRAEMLEVARGLWPTYFAGKPLPEGPDALRETVRAVLGRIADEHSTRDSIVADARKVVEDLRRFIREKGLVPLPEPDRCNLIVMPEFQAGVSTAYLDPAPPLDQSGKSFYAIEPFPSSWSEAEVMSRLREYNSHMLKILSIHEGYPGHYVQLEASNRYPSRIRKVLGNGPMIEGWAVYTERMMVEAGFAGGDPRLRLSRLKFYLRAVTNALLDRGLHCEKMTDEAALKLMTEEAFQEENEAKGKLVRAKVTATQLSTYFVGYQEIAALREELERVQGSGFSLPRFHEQFLSQGSPPVRVIRQALLGGG